MILEHLDHWASHILETSGLAGAAFLMALESMVFPIPSEVIMPPLGSLVQQGTFSWYAATLAASLGSLIGSLISYAIGYIGGKPLIAKLGKYAFLNQHHLDVTTTGFARYGGFMVFVSRFIPVVRHLISIPAGIARMPLLPFIFYTLLGATMWNTFLLYLGFKFHEQMTNNPNFIKTYSRPLDYIFIAVCILAALAWYFLSPFQTRHRVISNPRQNFMKYNTSTTVPATKQ